MRLTLLLLAAGIAGPGCDCGKTAPKVVAHPKDVGEGCATDTDCLSGLCASLPGSTTLLCQQPCDNGCPSGQRCIALGTSDGKTNYACASDPGKLCQTCTADTDCGYPGDACLQSGDVVSCGEDCSGDGICPSGYACTSATKSGGGTAARQCVPTSGTCACIEKSRGQTRPCNHSNSFGTCNGVETCDPASGYSGCDALVPAQEVCDGIDNDCNGHVDDGLGTSTCGQGACQVTVQNCVNGQPNVCQPDMTKSVPEVCNGKDDDCDGVIDNGFDLSTDTNNCGQCGRACPSQNATPTCQDGFCSLTCNPGFDDCNHNIVDGCEANLGGDVNNCGVCNNRCAFANGVPACGDGGCQLAGCDTNYYDLDQNPANGCEYACTFISDSDLPDVTDFPDGGVGFTDTNCDGLDGTIDGGVFVSPSGNDLNPGTMALPLRTVQKGVDTAFAAGLPNVYVASGSYSGPINLKDGVSLFGGYVPGPGAWARSLSAATTLSGSNPVLVGDDVHDVTVQLFTVLGQAASTPSGSSIAVQLTDSVNVVFDHLTISGSNGANGSDGANGGVGASGNVGSPGIAGYENSSFIGCDTDNTTPAGGAAGTNSSCTDANGGAGGAAGLSGNSGAVGKTSPGGAGGGAGNGSGNGNNTAPGGCNGSPGGNGSFTDGSPGAALGTFGALTYTPANGSDGSAGSDGIGGGGGGGGGGGTNLCDSWGSGGGAGGAGGCGGGKGTHGNGGGASIAIWLSSTNLEIDSCDITSGNGGNGGIGGKGGAGGAGAAGGGSPYGSSASEDDGSLGGVGGKGGNGARGGNAGGGGGGPSIGVLELSGASLANNNSSVVPGTAGLGGLSAAGVAGLKGADAQAYATYP